jgi:hypothetical protein
MNEDMAFKIIESAFNVCNLGIAYNFLSNRSGRNPDKEDLTPASRFNTIGWIDYALNLSPCVDFTQTYLGGHDSTIVITKQA